MNKWMITLLTAALAASVFAEEAAQSGFETKLSAGLTMTDGNSETLAMNASLVTEGAKEGLGSVIAGVEANYGENTVKTEASDAEGNTVVNESDEKTIENAKAFFNVKKTLSPMTFASLDGSVLHDDMASIDYRATLGPGLGVYVVKSDQRELSLEAGPSYVWEKVDGISNDYLALRFAQRYTCQVLPNAKLVQSLDYLPEAEDFDNYLLTAEVGVEAAMSERLGLRVVVKNQYDNRPAAGAERNDLSVIAGLSLTL